MATFSVLTSAFTVAKKQHKIEKRIRSIRNDPNRISSSSSFSENGINNNESASNSRASSPKAIHRQQSFGTSATTSTKQSKKNRHRRTQSSSVSNLFRTHSPSSKHNSPVSSPRRPRTRTITSTTAEITGEEKFQTDSELFMMYRSCSRYNTPRRSISAPTLSPLLTSINERSQTEQYESDQVLDEPDSRFSS